MCEFTNAEHIPGLEEVDKGIILVNKFNGEADEGNIANKILE